MEGQQVQPERHVSFLFFHKEKLALAFKKSLELSSFILILASGLNFKGPHVHSCFIPQEVACFACFGFVSPLINPSGY
jgi:hypothetical protein